jgi:hypothetical protein
MLSKKSAVRAQVRRLAGLIWQILLIRLLASPDPGVGIDAHTTN